MKIKQLSLFIENHPGALTAPCKALSDAGINISTLSLADTEDYGILRFIIKDWDNAKKILDAAGFTVNITDVVALEISDRPGGLTEVLLILDKLDINVEYMYAFTSGGPEKAYVIFRFEDIDDAVAVLQQEGINPVSPVELYS